MKHSPLQLSPIQYSFIDIRANPGVSDEMTAEAVLPVSVESQIHYEKDGDHFAGLRVLLAEEGYTYTINVEAFTTFRIDTDGCRDAYKQHFNPSVIGVNVARLLFSSCKEFVSTITARAPYGAAILPNLVIEPGDVAMRFEEGSRDKILSEYFGLTTEQLDKLKETARAKLDAQPQAEAEGREPPKKARRGVTKKA